MASDPAPGKNRFDLPEWAGAFGDLGTLIPFVAAYLPALKMDANGLLVAFGLSLIAVGVIYRTPFPVQPMKVVGVAAVSRTALAAGLDSATVVGAALTTGMLWIVLAATGLARRAAAWVPRPALPGVVILAGIQLAIGSREPGGERIDRVVFLATAAFAIWNVGIAVLFGIAAYHASKRGWLRV